MSCHRERTFSFVPVAEKAINKLMLNGILFSYETMIPKSIINQNKQHFPGSQLNKYTESIKHSWILSVVHFIILINLSNYGWGLGCVLFCYNLFWLAYQDDFYKLGCIHFQQTVKQKKWTTLQFRQGKVYMSVRCHDLWQKDLRWCCRTLTVFIVRSKQQDLNAKE